MHVPASATREGRGCPLPQSVHRLAASLLFPDY